MITTRTAIISLWMFVILLIVQPFQAEATINIEEWLNGLELGKYVEIFKENDITHEKILSQLTENDLKELGEVT